MSPTKPTPYRFILPVVTSVLLATTLYLIITTRHKDTAIITLENERTALQNELASTTAASLAERE